MHKKAYIILFIVLIILGVNFFYNEKKSLSIFSWENNELKLDNIDTMKKYLQHLDIKEIYQNIDEHSNEEIEKFVEQLKDIDVATYALAGDPSWYKENKYVKDYLNNIKSYNESVKAKNKIKKVVLDIEPWAAYETWDREIYIKNMQEIYTYAKGLGVKIITVIPTWLDSSDLDIIVKNCDEIAIMNYNVDSPVENIKEEIYIAKKYKKYVNVIAETQPANKQYGVQKNTTYYYLSHQKLLEDWNDIKEVYNYSKLDFSYHDYKNIKKFVGMEE